MSGHTSPAAHAVHVENQCAGLGMVPVRHESGELVGSDPATATGVMCEACREVFGVFDDRAVRSHFMTRHGLTAAEATAGYAGGDEGWERLGEMMRKESRPWATPRAPAPKRPRPPNATLTPARVRKIRELVAGGRSHASVAAEFGVGRKTVGDLVARKTWAAV